MGYSQEQSPSIYPTTALRFVYKHASFHSVKSLHYGKITNTAAIGVGKFLCTLPFNMYQENENIILETDTTSKNQAVSTKVCH
jgi:hypothetical protein